MGLFDRVLRGVAVLAAAAVVVIAALNSQLPLNLSSSARKPTEEERQEFRRQAADARTRGYAFLLSSPEHRYPARWCAGTIGFTIDTTELVGSDMDAGQEAARWQAVFDDWSRVSGGRYSFAYRGERRLTMDSDGQPDVNSVEPGTIGITFVHGDAAAASTEYRSAAVRGRTAGNGGLQVSSPGNSDAGSLIGDRGFVLIDVDDAASLNPDGLRRTLYQHESGHALGLGHVSDPAALMNGTLSTARSRVGPQDGAGLQALLRFPCEG